MAYGYVDDRAGATAALPPFPAPAENGEMLASPTSPQAPQQPGFLQAIGKEVAARPPGLTPPLAMMDPTPRKNRGRHAPGRNRRTADTPPARAGPAARPRLRHHDCRTRGSL